MLFLCVCFYLLMGLFTMFTALVVSLSFIVMHYLLVRHGKIGIAIDELVVPAAWCIVGCHHNLISTSYAICMEI